MNDFIIVMACYAVLITIIAGALLGEIINYFISIIEYEKRLRENRERAWHYFVTMGK